MLSIKVTKSARKDLIYILKYTLQEFGENQWQKYGELIDQTFSLISENPHIGHKRNDIPNYCYAWPMEKHNIIYKIENQNIYILRVLHQKMNFIFKF
jgi:toxin ParE1/3/4